MSKIAESPRTRHIKPRSEKTSDSSPRFSAAQTVAGRPAVSDASHVSQRNSVKLEEESKSPKSPPLISSGQARRGSSIPANAIGASLLSSIDIGVAVSNHMLLITAEKTATSVASICARGFAQWLPCQVVRVIGFERESGALDRLFLLASCGENCASPLISNSEKNSDPICLPKAGLTYRVARSGLAIRSSCDSSDISVSVDVGETFSPISGQIIVAPCLFNGSCVAVLTALGTNFSDSEYAMFQQVAKMTGIAIGNSTAHHLASISTRHCSLIQRASSILLRQRDLKNVDSNPIQDGRESQLSDNDSNLDVDADTEVHLPPTKATDLVSSDSSFGKMIIATSMLAKQLTMCKSAVVYILDDKSNSLYTWTSPITLSEPEDAFSLKTSPFEIKLPISKNFIEALSQTRMICSSNTSKDKHFEADTLRGFMSPLHDPSKSLSTVKGLVDQQYSTMLVGVSPSVNDIFGSSDVSSLANSVTKSEAQSDGSSIAVIIQIFEYADVYGQRKQFESFRYILEELGKILINALTFDSNARRSTSLDDGLLELAACKKKDDVFDAASLLVSSSLAVDWAAIYEISETGSFVWAGKASQNIPQSLGVGQHRKEILIGEAPVATYVINHNAPNVQPKFSQKGKGPVRIIRMGEQDYDDKRQRRLGGEIDRGVHPMMEAIKSGGPVHIPITMIDLKLLPQDFDGKRFNGFRCTAVVACPCYDEMGNAVAVVVAGNKRSGGWCRTGDMTFSATDVQLLQKISQHAGIAFSKARLFESFQFQQLHWFKLMELCQIISSIRDTTKLIDVIHELSPKILGCERAILFLRVPTEKELWTVLKPYDTSMNLGDSNLTFEQRVYLTAKRKAESSQQQALSEETYLVEFLKSVPPEVQSIFCRGMPLQTGIHDVPAGISAEKIISAASSASSIMSSEGGREIRVKYTNSIAGVAADTARVVNLRGPAAYADFLNPSTDCIFRPVCGPMSVSQKFEQEIPKHILAVPIFSGSSPGDVIGVLQLINKIDIEQNHFTLSPTGDPLSFGLTATSAWQTLARPGKLTSSTNSIRFLKTLVGLETKRMMDEVKSEPLSLAAVASAASIKRKLERQQERDEKQMIEDGDAPDKKSFNAGDAAVATYVSASIASSFQHGFALQKRFAVEEELRSIINVYGVAIRSSQDLSSTTNLSELLQKLSKQLRHLVHATQVTLYMKASKAESMDVYHLVGSCVSEVFKQETSKIGGIAGYVFNSEKPVNTPRAFEHPSFDRNIDERPNLPIYSLVAWPITTQYGKVIGVLSCGNKSVASKKKHHEEADVPGSISAIESKILDCDEDLPAVSVVSGEVDSAGQAWCRFTYMDEKLISVIADELGVAFLNVDRYNRINKLHVTLKELHSEVHLSKAMRHIGQVISKTFTSSSANIFIKDADTGQYLWTEIGSQNSSAVTKCYAPYGEGLVGICASTGEIINIPESSKSVELLWGCYSGEFPAQVKYAETLIGIKNALALPIKDSVGAVFAVLQLVDSDQKEGFSADDISLLQIFCTHASLTLKQCLKHDELTSSLESTRLILKCTSSLVGCVNVSELGTLATTLILSLMPCKEPSLLVLDADDQETWLKYESNGEPKRSRFAGIAAHVVTSGDLINTSSSKNLSGNDENSISFKSRQFADASPGKKTLGKGHKELQHQSQKAADSPPISSDAVGVAGVLCVPLVSRNKVKILGAFQITAVDNKRLWGLQDEESLKGFASVVSVALENLQAARAHNLTDM